MPCLSAQLQTVAEFEAQNASRAYDQAVKPLQQIKEATTHDDSIQSLQCETPSKLIPTWHLGTKSISTAEQAQCSVTFGRMP